MIGGGGTSRGYQGGVSSTPPSCQNFYFPTPSLYTSPNGLPRVEIYRHGFNPRHRDRDKWDGLPGSSRPLSLEVRWVEKDVRS